MESLLQDLRFALRLLFRSKAITLTVVATLALGIGANSAMFSVVSAVLLHSASYQDLSTLATVTDRNAQGGQEGASPANFLDWRAQVKSFSELAGWANASFGLLGGATPVQIGGAEVTANFFHTLGVRPVLGRTFLPDEDGIDPPSNAARVCVIGYRLWQETLGRDPNVLGRTVFLNQKPYAVVGVMPAEFYFWNRNVQVWIPVSLDRQNRSYHYLVVVGRLREPASRAAAEMSAMARSLDQAYPKTNKGWTIQVQDLGSWLVDPTFRMRLLLLSGALGLVLALACTNIASLLLARSATRSREIALRRAVGASRGRLIRQLLTESAVLTLAGAAAGLGLARALIRMAPAMLPANALPAGTKLALNPEVLLFTLCVSLAAGILFGLAPALGTTRPDVHESLQDSSRGSTTGRTRQLFRRAMVAMEVAVALMLLATAGLMITSLRNLTAMDLGFNPQNILAWNINLPSDKYNSARALELHRRALERIAALPGVESAAVGSSLPLEELTMLVPLHFENSAQTEGGDPAVGYASIDVDYLRTLGIPIKRGRAFQEADNATSPPVAMVNEAFVQRYLPHTDPVRQRLKINRPILGGNGFGPPVEIEIVGVAGNVTLGHLGAEATPILYVPHAQNVWRRISWFAVRTSVEPTRLAGAIRREMAALEKDQPINRLGTLDDKLATQFAEPRFQAGLMSIFAGLGLVLAAMGIYGINAQSVAQRRHEIGLRMALGASPGRMFRETVVEGLKLTACGIAVGVAGAWGIASVLRSVLVGVSPTDPITLAAVAFLLAAIAAVACCVPASRAVRIDPAITLRQE